MTVWTLDGIVPEIDRARCWIAPSASVIGRVVLGDEVSIWFGAVLRGDLEEIRIGARSNVQELCVLHTDAGFPLTVGEDVTVGHRAILHGCTIGDGTLIGMGAVVLNGAVIGRDCVVGAGAVVPEGRQVPDRSLVFGIPGKVAGEVTEAQARFGREGAARYVLNARRFRSGLAPIEDAQEGS